MKKLLLVLACIVALAANAQTVIPYQRIGYNIHYHWGPIDVTIAHGSATVESDGSTFKGTMDGNSIPWDGRIYCVSDTLTATMTPGANGLSHENVTYQTGWYLKPKVREYRSGNFNPANPANYRNIAGNGTLNASDATMEAITVTSDMLGLFYYFHQLDFESMTPGQRTVINISGGYANEVVITYHGQSTYTAAGVTYPTYKVEFEYSYQGAMSGYPVHAQVAADSRIPVLFSASLPAGHVEMIYDGM